MTGERPRVMAEALQRDARRQYGSSRTLAPVESVGERRVVSVAVRRAQAGDRDALRFLYERYARDVQRHVRPVVRDDHEAEDVTQLVFVKLMTAIIKYDERAVPFFAWLARLSQNVAVDHRRTRYDARSRWSSRGSERPIATSAPGCCSPPSSAWPVPSARWCCSVTSWA